jgi:hypothetical protein
VTGEVQELISLRRKVGQYIFSMIILLIPISIVVAFLVFSLNLRGYIPKGHDILFIDSVY